MWKNIIVCLVYVCVYIYIKADKYSKIIIIIIVGTRGLRKKLKDRNVGLRTKEEVEGSQ